LRPFAAYEENKVLCIRHFTSASEQVLLEEMLWSRNKDNFVLKDFDRQTDTYTHIHVFIYSYIHIDRF